MPKILKEEYQYDSINPKRKIVWRNVAIFVFLHSFALYTLFRATKMMIYTWMWVFFIGYMFGHLGVIVGHHRLWSHRSYKATLPLKIFLAFCSLVAFQNSIWEWSRDHRVHHRFSETDADPHNARRGFFFSHMGWLLVAKHPDVKRKGKEVDLSDLEADPIVMFQKKYYLPLGVMLSFVLPSVIPTIFWGESLLYGYSINIFRYVVSLHGTWLVNSAAHLWGSHPYDVTINPAQSIIANSFSLGEGFHNYHHTFPHDYAASEYGMYFNYGTIVINFFEKIGLAYDLKKVSQATIDARKRRTGCLSARTQEKNKYM